MMRDKISKALESMGPEKRRYKRFVVDVMEINGKMTFANEVEILDISIGGVSLKADRRLNIGSEYTLKLGDSAKVISLKASVVWAMLSETRKNINGDMVPIYTAGMKFTDLSIERMAELTHFIESHRQEDDQRDLHELSGLRFNIRFYVGASEKAVIDYPERYRVKKLSLGGMLIESSHEIPGESKLPMDLSLPNNKDISFVGRVASCIPTSVDKPGRYDLGIEFIEMSEGGRKDLTEFINILKKLDEDKAN